MPRAKFDADPVPFSDVLEQFTEQRRLIIKTLLTLPRDAWRIPPHRGKWSVAKIAEHLCHVDALWVRLLRMFIRLSFLFPAKPGAGKSRVSDPFSEQKPLKTYRIISNPRGKMRRKAMIGSLDQNARTIEHLLDKLPQQKFMQLRILSPVGGLNSASDGLRLLYYHDRNHLLQIQRAIVTLRAKGVNVDQLTDPSPDETAD